MHTGTGKPVGSSVIPRRHRPAIGHVAVGLWLALAVGQASAQVPDMPGTPARPTANAAGNARTQPILDEATLKREYEAYRTSVKGMRRYQVHYIRVAGEAEARELIAKIRSGGTFRELATKHSLHKESAERGGDLGCHAGCRWAKATLEILDSLKGGQTWPQPVKGTHGWGIYRLDSVVAIEPRSFSQYKAELLSGKFEPECPWVPPVAIGNVPAAGPGTAAPMIPPAGRRAQ